MNRTLGLRVSPWTERARARSSRARIRTTSTPADARRAPATQSADEEGVRVPLLDDGGDVVMGSVRDREARREEQGWFESLPEGKEAEIDHWADVAERMTSAGRNRLLGRMLQSKRRRSGGAAVVRAGVARGVLAPSAGMAVRFTSRTSTTSAVTRPRSTPRLRHDSALSRRRVRPSRRAATGPLEGLSSFADIALASPLQVLMPRMESLLGPATREAWTNEKLRRSSTISSRGARHGSRQAPLELTPLVSRARHHGPVAIRCALGTRIAAT